MEDVQYIADTLEKPMRRINATRQTDLEQLEIVSYAPSLLASIADIQALKAAMKAKPNDA
jgi:hypothetical protein